MKKTYSVILLILVILLLIFIFFLKRPKQEIVHPKIGPITESVYAISSVKSEWYYSLKMGVLSTVKTYYVKEGDFVNSGDKLLQIEENNTIFKAPHQGIVTERPFGIKETIGPQAPILKIVDLKNLYLEASIEQLGALKITKGMKVIISFEDFRSKNFVGTVRSILPRDQDFLIQVSSQQLPPNILPGMSADLSIEIGTKTNALLIPTKAISNGYIVLLKNKKATKVKVELGISDTENAELLSPPLSVEDEILLPQKENL
jgi:multidrug efflux pump subunit AcrA (membrane-fusion protein)